MHAPTRPFESLDWFREATKREYRTRGPLRSAVLWLKSSRCFAFHIGLFALGITMALAIDVARDPGDIWVDRLAVGWAILLVIHAGILLLLWALGLLGSDGNRVPVYPGTVLRPRQLDVPSTPANDTNQWPAPPPDRVPEAPETKTPPPTSNLSGWDQWGQRAPADGWSATATKPPANGGAEPASWQETAPGAWLGRRRSPAPSEGDDAADKDDGDKSAAKDTGS